MYRRSCWASQTWFKRNLFIGLSPAHAEARAGNPRFQVVAGSFTHSKVSAKINRAPLGSVPRDYTQDLAGIRAPVLLIHGRYDRMVPFEVTIAILKMGSVYPRSFQVTPTALNVIQDISQGYPLFRGCSLATGFPRKNPMITHS
jgi:pimeloyl-ACP methyl ester carboxylesterase